MGKPLNGWHDWIEEGIEQPYMEPLWQFLNHRYETTFVFPEPELLFEAFVHCPLDDLKVVIVGQDPYHTEFLAHGLAFSVPEGEDLPPSLKNIYKELKADLDVDRGAHGDLTDWARQGVLLINPILTVEEKKPASHERRGWERFTGNLLMRACRHHKKPLIIVLWGKKAETWARPFITKKDIVLVSSHPSPLGVASGKNPFRGCRHFSIINQHLIRLGQEPIHWGVQGG